MRLSKGERDRTNCVQVSREKGSQPFQLSLLAYRAVTTKQLQLKCQQGKGGSHQKASTGGCISLLYNGCSLVLKKLWWIMKDIYQTLEKFQCWKKLTIIYQRLEATMYFSLCDMETHVQWVGGFLIQHQTHTIPLVIGFSRIQNSAPQVIEHLTARNKIIPNGALAQRW